MPKATNMTPNSLSCARCAAPFPITHDGAAHGCATRLRADGKLYGEYGSGYDLTALDVLQPNHVPAGVVCDGCIGVLIAIGALRVDHTYDPFEHIDPKFTSTTGLVPLDGEWEDLFKSSVP